MINFSIFRLHGLQTADLISSIKHQSFQFVILSLQILRPLTWISGLPTDCWKKSSPILEVWRPELPLHVWMKNYLFQCSWFCVQKMIKGVVLCSKDCGLSVLTFHVFKAVFWVWMRLCCVMSGVENVCGIQICTLYSWFFFFIFCRTMYMISRIYSKFQNECCKCFTWNLYSKLRILNSVYWDCVRFNLLIKSIFAWHYSRGLIVCSPCNACHAFCNYLSTSAPCLRCNHIFSVSVISCEAVFEIGENSYDPSRWLKTSSMPSLHIMYYMYLFTGFQKFFSLII